MRSFQFTIVTCGENHVDYTFEAENEVDAKKYMHKMASELELSTRHFRAV